MRVALVIAIAVTATLAHADAGDDWSITSPPEWTRVDATDAFAAENLPGVPRRYRSPDAPDDELVVVKFQFDGESLRKTIAKFLARGMDDRLPVDKKSITVNGDEGIGELVFVDDARLVQFRVLAGIDHVDRYHDVVFARCTTSKAAAPTCAAALASMKLQSAPATKIDDSQFIQIGTWVVAILLALASLFTLGRYLLRRRASARKTPLQDGELVTLTGRVRSIEPLLSAPLSGTPCVVHRSRMYLLGSPTAKDNAVIESSRFLLETPNGNVLIDTTPELDLVPSPVVPRQESRELGFLASRGIPEARHRDAGFDEIVIAPGVTVVIRGLVKIELDHGDARERGYRDDAPTVTRLVGTDNTPMTIRKTW